jgi:hypothetical protein
MIFVAVAIDPVEPSKLEEKLGANKLLAVLTTHHHWQVTPSKQSKY